MAKSPLRMLKTLQSSLSFLSGLVPRCWWQKVPSSTNMPTTISLVSNNLTIGLLIKNQALTSLNKSATKPLFSIREVIFMSHIRLIISDIDGTILNDHHQIDPELAALIPDLKREEIPFVLASARSPQRNGTHCQRTRYRRLPHGLLQRGLDSKKASRFCLSIP